MLGLEYLTDRIPGFLVSVFGIEDSTHLPIRQVSAAPLDIALQDLLMEGFGSLLGGGVALLESQVSTLDFDGVPTSCTWQVVIYPQHQSRLILDSISFADYYLV
jgi:hypothetical protein